MIHVMRTDLAAAGNRQVALGQLGCLTKMMGIFLIVLLLGGCRHPVQEPVTLTFLDPEWSHDLTERNVQPDERLLEFTRQTMRGGDRRKLAAIERYGLSMTERLPLEIPSLASTVRYLTTKRDRLGHLLRAL